ncbi:hypothetical protein [Chondromyces apiculatus]|uniref:Protein kinase domain-containing protein n=1 Tax=Chondromyces apiculatus DSM 436 TaxID=1192034 RepID=A0A017TFY6_9BACT|nr:hypothetical protein [Chondromyces apiculatus]EYF07735.1 Hypothetical protein CAP_8236 [Chondromyces apiculatus DSM 436]
MSGAGDLPRRAPDPAWVPEGKVPEALGRASRWRSEDGEIWRLAATEEGLARRLLTLGEAGIGGFVEGGVDAEGVWLRRMLGGASLAARLRERRGPWAWEEALAVGLSLARVLAFCEKASLFPGPLTPQAVLLGSQREAPGQVRERMQSPERAPEQAAWLHATALVEGMVGVPGGAARGTEGLSPLWTPPEQADGALWDSAANRYALGLLLYHLLAGEHPFSGAGLRHAMGEAAHREPPPFPEVVAEALPPGLQSRVLRLLDPDAERRPQRAQEIVEALQGFVRGEGEGDARGERRERGERGERGSAVGRSAGETRGAQVVQAARGARATRESAGGAREERGDTGSAREERGDTGSARQARDGAARAGRGAEAGDARARRVTEGGRSQQVLRRAVPLAVGAVVGIGALALIEGAAPAPTRPVATVLAERPLGSGETLAQDCAACHGRQAAEWRRSVMAHAVKSPLFNALEILIEEQNGRDADCPNGPGFLRRADPSRACRDRRSGLVKAGTGGEHWCVNCHSPAETLEGAMPAWDGRAGGDARGRLPVRDLVGPRGLEGISCGFCHEVHGPVGPRGSGGYQGNPSWTSFVTGAVFPSRPEDGRGLFGIANSGFSMREDTLLLPAGTLGAPGAREARDTSGGAPGKGVDVDDPVVHRRPSASAKAYLRSSEFCGSCHDVRLFGSDTVGAQRGEHFKRLRNAYSEWVAWSRQEERAGREPASCQGCHMSTFPGVCVPDGSAAKAGAAPEGCPPGTRFEARAPGIYAKGRVADGSSALKEVTNHYFSGVDLPLGEEFLEALVEEEGVDAHGMPVGVRGRRDLLLRHTFRLGVEGRAERGRLEIPVTIENVGAGHRVPAGFSQERETWVHLVVRDGGGRVVYEVGRVDRADEDLHDKEFLRVGTRPDRVDAQGRPEGLFGADVRDGPDVPEWSPPTIEGGTSFRGRGLINFQNGFLRCVRCIGVVAPDGSCTPGPGQGTHRADRYADGDYDLDTGECRSNLTGMNALFETYFPVGALDASRGEPKAPDAIIDTRSAPPGVPLRYTYTLPTGGRSGPFRVEARLLFRAFPPFLIRGFADYEQEQARRGLRPGGPLVTREMLGRLEIVELERAEAEIR